MTNAEKEESRKRQIRLTLRITPEEKFLLEAKMKLCGYRNMSGYIRQVAVYDKVIIRDMTEINNMTKEINKIGVNINQLVARVNSTSTAYKEDINYLKDKLEEIYNTQISILRKFGKN